jgi:predicted transcriptional regulator of viral defense system
MKYVKELRQEFREKPFFTIKDLKVLLGGKRISESYLHVLIHNLLGKGEIHRIARGVYTFREDVQTVGFAFSPFYYGLQDALSFRNLWEQETNPVIVTPRRVRTGTRTFLGRNFVVKRISRKMFFGFEMLKYHDFWVPVSDTEKTLIDFAYFNEPLQKETLEEIKARIRAKVLEQYLKKSPKKTVKKVQKLLK